MNKKRQSNFELLRIVAIICIIAFHYVYKSEYVFSNLTKNSLLIESILMLGELGVNIFILISGYFQCKSKFSIKKLTLLILEVYFYYGLNLIFEMIFLGKPIVINFRIFVFKSIPIIMSQYWFATAYILIYIFSPFINKLIDNLKKEMFLKLITILLVVWCIIPTITGLLLNSSEELMFYNRFLWLIVMYLIGAYIRIYDIKTLKDKKVSVLVVTVTYILMVLSIVLIYYNFNVFSKIGTLDVAYFWRPNTIPMVILSIALFCLFKESKIKNNIVINTIASTTFGIYLIHDGPFNEILWKNIFDSYTKLQGAYPIENIIITIIIIFGVGTIIDFIRQVIEKTIIIKIFKLKIWNQLKLKINKTWEDLSDIL